MLYDIRMRTITPQVVLSIREDTTPEAISEALGEILAEVHTALTALGIEPVTPPFARFHMLEPTRVVIEAGFGIAGVPVRGNPALPFETRALVGALPGGLAVVTVHVGPYDTLPAAQAALRVWMQDHGYEPDGAHWEVYWTDPAELLDPAQWRTEIIWPVREAAASG